jgi:hypothetical protein
MATATKKVSKRSIWFTIIDVDGTWATAAGGARTRGQTKTRDGGAKNTETIPGQAEYENLVLTRPYDHSRDIDAETYLLDLVEQASSAVELIRFTDKGAAGIVRKTLTGTVVGVGVPEADSMSSEAAMLSVTIAIDSMI